MYAVVGVWSMDESRHEEQQRTLHEQIVPLTRKQPGFVTGYWMRDAETGKSHTAMVFDDEQSAGAFKRFVESRSREAAMAGVTADFFALVEVVADARGV
ncbi:YdhR family protein [Streptomyces sp. NPDC047081]|uniref:YdhR family protein n=1 Tax=Streptomyces sp. NPDC047081 TaxID=3154706 RepID=UPI0033C65574